MKLLLDFFPIVIFFIVYKTYGLNLAIIAMTLATVVQILYTRWQSGKFEKMQVITLGLLILFGGLTIYINNPAFIMWKVSIFYIVFGAIILATLFTKQTIIQKLMGKNITAPAQIWRKVSWLWGIAFMGIAAINAYFVDLALVARERFLSVYQGEVTDLVQFDCNTVEMVNRKLCMIAKSSEGIWVDFKLFGTMGLTFVLIVITVVMLKKYINTNDKHQ